MRRQSRARERRPDEPCEQLEHASIFGAEAPAAAGIDLEHSAITAVWKRNGDRGPDRPAAPSTSARCDDCAVGRLDDGGLCTGQRSCLVRNVSKNRIEVEVRLCERGLRPDDLLEYTLAVHHDGRSARSGPRASSPTARASEQSSAVVATSASGAAWARQ